MATSILRAIVRGNEVLGGALDSAGSLESVSLYHLCPAMLCARPFLCSCRHAVNLLSALVGCSLTDRRAPRPADVEAWTPTSKQTRLTCCLTCAENYAWAPRWCRIIRLLCGSMLVPICQHGRGSSEWKLWIGLRRNRLPSQRSIAGT